MPGAFRIFANMLSLAVATYASPEELQRQLNVARIAGGAADSTELRGPDRRARKGELRVIEQIEELRPELNILCSSIEKLLKMEKSQLLMPGPITVLRPAVPQRNGAAGAKASVLNQRSIERFSTSLGSPIWSGRAEPSPGWEHRRPGLQ